MEGELNFLTTAQKPLLESSSWIKTWTESVEYWFGSKPLKPPPQIELVEHTGGVHELPEKNPEKGAMRKRKPSGAQTMTSLED